MWNHTEDMSGYGFFRMLQMLAVLAMFPLIGLSVCITYLSDQIDTENHFRRTYGAEWRAEYEKTYGSLAQHRAKAAAGSVGGVAIVGLAVWLWRVIKNPGVARRRKPERWRRESHLERTFAYRRKALLGVYFGLPGVFVGALLMIFRWGIFQEHQSEVILGIVVFLAGFIGIMVGCVYWLKAKQWNEAIASIAIMPLGIFYIPFVRLIFVAQPLLLLLFMFTAVLILVVVVLTLPDKSGVGKRKSAARYSSERQRQFLAGIAGSKRTQSASKPPLTPPGRESNPQ